VTYRSPRLALIAILLLAPHADAQQPAQPGGEGGKIDPEALLAQAEKAYEALEYETALKTLIAVHRVPGVSSMQRARSFLYMGVCFTALGNAENAVQSFIELLKLKPSFRLPPGISPSIHAMFKEALLRLKLPETPPPESQPTAPEGPKRSGPSVSVSVKGPPKSRAGEAVTVSIELQDPEKQVEDVILHWRLVGGPDYKPIRVKLTAGQKLTIGRIPGTLLGKGGERLHYLVEALGKGGLTLAHAGTMNSPFEVEIEAVPKPKRKWGWYLLGVGGGLAIAGGVVAAILLTRSDPPPPMPADTAEITIRIR
jgi:hypothetical protein